MVVTDVELLANGGVFVRGGAYDRESTRRSYAHVAVVRASGDTYLSARFVFDRRTVRSKSAELTLAFV